ncbi:MAG: hypothetical protein WA822_03595, partial [Albidovulum sp.]
GTPMMLPMTIEAPGVMTGNPAQDPISEAKKTFTAIAPAAKGNKISATLGWDHPCCITAAVREITGGKLLRNTPMAGTPE